MRRLGQNYIGCERQLLAAAAGKEPASAALCDQSITPKRVEGDPRTIGRRRPLGPVDQARILDC